MERFNPQPKPIKPDKKKPARVPQISPQQMVRLAEYLPIMRKYLRDHSICEVGPCRNPSNEVHHKKGKVGKLLIDTEFFLASCYKCHRYIEEHPQWSYQKGYSLSRGQKMLGGGLSLGKFIF